MSAGQDSESRSSGNQCPVSSRAEAELGTTPERKELREGALEKTPSSKFKKVHSKFKSPLQVCDSGGVRPAEEEVAELERRREQLDAEMAQLEAEGYRESELEHHINKLHEYNDIKDIGLSLLGRIAALRGTTTRHLYSHFGLELDD
uniref:DNA repair protein SWI5 homolog n=1 Tax=Mola mola TaxID=94237 RepID=A0A3Q3XLR7_MOLML